jgi:hypothetical protein
METGRVTLPPEYAPILEPVRDWLTKAAGLYLGLALICIGAYFVKQNGDF